RQHCRDATCDPPRRVARPGVAAARGTHLPRMHPRLERGHDVTAGLGASPRNSPWITRPVHAGGLSTRLPPPSPDTPTRTFPPMTQVPPSPDPLSVGAPPDAMPQGELEFITELCAVVAEQSELQPILDWLVHKSTRLLGADECSIKLLTAGGDTAKTIIFD